MTVFFREYSAVGGLKVEHTCIHVVQYVVEIWEEGQFPLMPPIEELGDPFERFPLPPSLQPHSTAPGEVSL